MYLATAVSYLETNMTNNSYQKNLNWRTSITRNINGKLDQFPRSHSICTYVGILFNFWKMLIPGKQRDSWGCIYSMEGRQANVTDVCSWFSVCFCLNTGPVYSSELAAQKNTLHFCVLLHPLAVSPYLHTYLNLHRLST